MPAVVQPRARLGIAGFWRDAWRIAEANPLLLLVAIALLAGTVEACGQSMSALAAIPVPVKFGYLGAGLIYCGLVALNQVLLTGVGAGVALVMLVVASSEDSGRRALSRRHVGRFFLRVILGWLVILGLTAVVAWPMDTAVQIFSAEIRGRSLEWSVTIASALVFAIVQAAMASALFLRLPDALRETPRAAMRGERRGLFLIYLMLFLATGLVFAMAWVWWPDMSYPTNTRLVDAKLALDGWWVALLALAARPDTRLDPSELSVFE